MRRGKKIQAEEQFQQGREAYQRKDYKTAKQKFITANSLGHEEAFSWLKKTNARIKALEEQKAAIERQKTEQSLIPARKAYGKLLRNHFLDQGLDIEVRVHGPNNKYITLEYVLIGDVFVHNFKKGDLCDEIHEMGFTRVYLTDGYDFSTYVYWK